MFNSLIYYKSGYKYQLVSEYKFQTCFIFKKYIKTDFILFENLCEMTISAGYAWDGPSGPTFDTDTFMRGSLEHDALYELLRLGHLPESYREQADNQLGATIIDDGMSPIRAMWVYAFVRMGGGPSASPRNKKPILISP